QATNVFLLGQAYVNWSPGNHNLRAGRFKLATPFFNPQDSRMIPTLAQGVGYRYKNKKWDLEAYYINALAPRSTPKWRLLRNSIGIYSQGRNPNGTPGKHLGNTNTDGLAIVGLKRKGTELVDVQLYHYYLQN